MHDLALLFRTAPHIATQGPLLLLYTYTVRFGDISHCIYCFLSVWIVRLDNISTSSDAVRS